MAENRMYNNIAKSFASALKDVGLEKGSLKEIAENLKINTTQAASVSNRMLREERGVTKRFGYSSEISSQVQELQKLRQFSPIRRGEQTYGSGGFSSVLESQYLEGVKKKSVTELTNRELDTLIKSMEKLKDTVARGKKEIDVFSTTFSDTMQNLSGEGKKGFLDTAKSFGKNLITPAALMSRGLQEGSATKSVMGLGGLIMGAKAIGGIAGPIGGLVAGDLATSYAATQIAKPHLMEAAMPSLAISQLRQMSGGGSSLFSGLGAIQTPGDPRSMDYARLRTLELMSGKTVSAEQMTSSLLTASGRTNIGGGVGGSLATSLSQYGGAGIGMETFNNAVDKFSRVANQSNLVQLVNKIPEIAGRGGGAVTPEIVSGITTLASQLRFGRGLDRGNETEQTAMGIRGSMLMLQNMGIQGGVHQLNMLQGMQGGLENMSKSSAGMGLLFRATGNLSYALDPSQMLKDPKALAQFAEQMTSPLGAMGLTSGSQLGTSMSKRFLQQQFGASPELVQYLLTYSQDTKGGTPEEKMRRVSDQLQEKGASLGERSSKSQQAAGVGLDTYLYEENKRIKQGLKSLSEALSEGVKSLADIKYSVQNVAISSPNITLSINSSGRSAFSTAGGK